MPITGPALECSGNGGRKRDNSVPGKKIEAAAKGKPDFEQSLARLEEIVRKLESANLPLDEAMKLFEEGMQLSRDCQQQLEQAEARVEILLKKAGGEMVAEPFEPEGEEETLTRAFRRMKLPAFFEEDRQAVDAAIDCLLPPADARPASIHHALRYSVFAGGKRVRPDSVP